LHRLLLQVHIPCVRLPFAHSLQYASFAPSAFSHMSAAKSFTVLALLHLPHLLRWQSEQMLFPSGSSHCSRENEDLVLLFLQRGQCLGMQPLHFRNSCGLSHSSFGNLSCPPRKRHELQLLSPEHSRHTLRFNTCPHFVAENWSCALSFSHCTHLCK
jgi:hypothetical protein